MWETLFQTKALAQARAAMEAEPASARETRLAVRRLWDDAEMLALQDADTAVSRAALHAQAIRLAGGAEASPTLTELRAQHASALQSLELLVNARDQALRLRIVRPLQTLIVIALAVVAARLLVTALLRPTDLASGKPWRTSSSGLVCEPSKHRCGGTRTDIFFHTQNESNPWFIVDLGEPKDISQLTIRNRQDMGVARAVPLVVSVGDDGERWTEVARRDEPFDVWEPRFNTVKARQVRLQVLKKTWFHLEAVQVHP